MTYRPARLHRLAESIPELLKRLQLRAQCTYVPGTNSLDGTACELLQVLDTLTGVGDGETLVAAHLLLTIQFFFKFLFFYIFLFLFFCFFFVLYSAAPQIPLCR